MKWSPTGWGAKIVEGEREYSLPVEKWGGVSMSFVKAPLSGLVCFGLAGVMR